MKAIFKLLAAAAIVAAAVVAPSCNQPAEDDIIVREAPAENAPIFEGLWFNSLNIVDMQRYEIEGEAGVFYVLYDDIDAGMDYEMIRVSVRTWEMLKTNIGSGNAIKGELYAVEGCDSVIYDLAVEE